MWTVQPLLASRCGRHPTPEGSDRVQGQTPSLMKSFLPDSEVSNVETPKGLITGRTEDAIPVFIRSNPGGEEASGHWPRQRDRAVWVLEVSGVGVRPRPGTWARGAGGEQEVLRSGRHPSAWSCSSGTLDPRKDPGPGQPSLALLLALLLSSALQLQPHVRRVFSASCHPPPPRAGGDEGQREHHTPARCSPCMRGADGRGPWSGWGAALGWSACCHAGSPRFCPQHQKRRDTEKRGSSPWGCEVARERPPWSFPRGSRCWQCPCLWCLAGIQSTTGL